MARGAGLLGEKSGSPGGGAIWGAGKAAKNVRAAKITVLVWVRKTTNYQAIRDELLELAVDDPYESTEYKGMVDFHWGFDRMSKADQLAGSLREFAEKPEVVVLRVTLGNRAARDIVAGARSSLDRNPQHLRDHGGQFR